MDEQRRFVRMKPLDIASILKRRRNELSGDVLKRIQNARQNTISIQATASNPHPSMNTNEGISSEERYGIEVRYDARNVALVNLSDYNKLQERIEALEKALKSAFNTIDCHSSCRIHGFVKDSYCPPHSIIIEALDQLKKD
jgi:hypothetical protein